MDTQRDAAQANQQSHQRGHREDVHPFGCSDGVDGTQTWAVRCRTDQPLETEYGRVTDSYVGCSWPGFQPWCSSVNG